MMAWMRMSVLRSVNGMSQSELDFLLDDKANSTGALLMLLAALASAFIGVMSNLFEQVDRHSEEERQAARQKRRENRK